MVWETHIRLVGLETIVRVALPRRETLLFVDQLLRKAVAIVVRGLSLLT